MFFTLFLRPQNKEKMSIKKQTFKSKPQVKVTFNIPAEIAGEAAQAAIVGDFNNWNSAEGEMNRLKSGEFKTVLELEPNKEYQFRYLVDNSRWLNEDEADKTAVNQFGSENSVLAL